MRRLLTVLTISMLLAAPRPADAQTTADRVRELAGFLAPSDASAVCQVERRMPELEGPTRSCRWTVSTSPRADTMVLSQYPGDTVLLQLDRQFTDGAAAAQFVDALVGFGRRLDLTMRDCGAANTPAGDARGRLLFSEQLILHVTAFDKPDVLPRVALMATNVPSAFPTDLMCPGDAFGHGSTP
jgi:hypothetical protein